MLNKDGGFIHDTSVKTNICNVTVSMLTFAVRSKVRSYYRRSVKMCVYFAKSAKTKTSFPHKYSWLQLSFFFFQKQTSADCSTKILAKMHLWLETRGCSRAYITTDRVNQLVDTSVCQAKESTQLFPAGSLTVWQAAMHFSVSVQNQ